MSEEKELSPEEQNSRMAMKMIRNEIKRILDAWDPLCLKGLRGFQTEYAPYVGPLSIMVKKGADSMEIARHLRSIMIDEWKMEEDRRKCVEVAEKIRRTGLFLNPGQ